MWHDRCGVPEIRIRVAVCLLDGDRVLLVEHEKEGRRYWLLPGGGVEMGETLVDAAAREVREETGFDVEVGRLLLVCESIEPISRRRTRHLVNLVFAGRMLGGTLRPGLDGRLVDAGWQPVSRLAVLPMYPPIGSAVAACCAEGLEGPVRSLGNVWATQSDAQAESASGG